MSSQQAIMTLILSKLKPYILRDRDFSHWQILPFVCPLNYNVTLLLSNQARAKMAGIVNNVYSSHHSQAHSVIGHSYMAESACGKDEVNSAF